eukprot:m.112615 g.112615  ORF g.112615 m.112615 type:complete len:59 (-) comp13483_c0_seq8:299-475(-)
MLMLWLLNMSVLMSILMCVCCLSVCVFVVQAGTLDEPASSKPGWQYIDPKTLRGVKEH